MKITYLGHAALMAEAGGRRLLMDPWLEDPAYLNSWWHYPPLALGIGDLGTIDYVYCSHEHPDHFDPKTLVQLPRETTLLVPQFTSRTLERLYDELGFHNRVSLPFGETVELEGGMRVTCYRTDLVWEDSSLVVEFGETGIFNQNDCKLSDEALAALGGRHDIDLAFFPFSGAIQYPTRYEMSDDRKRELCASRRQGHLKAFVERARALRPRMAVPFAGNFCLLDPDEQWMNEINNLNTPDEAIAALAAELPEVAGLQMNPGDTWTPERGLERMHPVPDWGRRLDVLKQRAEEGRAEFERLRASEPPARPSLSSDVEAYFRERVGQHGAIAGAIDARVVIEANGAQAGLWALRFDERGLTIEDSAPEDWTLWIKTPDHILQQLVDRAVCWDEALISFRMSFAENPEFFNEAFWAMLYSPGPEFMREYFELNRPLALGLQSDSAGEALADD